MARDDDDRPRRPRRYDDRDDEYTPPPRKSQAGLMIGVLVGIFVVVCGGGGFLVYRLMVGAKAAVVQVQQTMQQAQVRAQADAETAEVRTNLAQIGRALNDYQAAQANRLPNDSYARPAKGGRPTSRPLLSWRVHLLPHLGQGALYRQFKLDEPWDSPANRPLVDQMPAVYGGPAAQVVSGPGKTFFRGFSHKGSVFERPVQPGQDGRVAVAGIPDGTANTLTVVEAAQAIEWTRPDEWDWPAGGPRPQFGGADPRREFFLALTADGQVRRVRMTVADQSLRYLIDRADGMVVPEAWEAP